MNQLRIAKKGNVEIIFGTGDHAFTRQTHKSYIFGALLAGKEIMKIGDELVTLEAGGSYVLPSHTPMECWPEGKITYVSVCFKKELTRRFLEYCPQYYFSVEKADKLVDCVHRFQKDLISEKDLIWKFAKLFSLWKRRENTEFPQIVSHALNYIEQHADSKYDLDRLAREIHSSKYYFTRQFKKTMGITPKRYHQQCRLRKVKENILRYSQSELAYNMGFSSQSHMESLFIEYMGISLGKYISALSPEQTKG